MNRHDFSDLNLNDLEIALRSMEKFYKLFYDNHIRAVLKQ